MAAASAQPKTQRVFEVVCERIRRDVDKGRLRPGDKLPPERDLAGALGVSRAAVREGLRALEASGVLELRQGTNGGAFIREVSHAGVQASIADMRSIGNMSLEHLAEARTVLLASAASLACTRATPSDLLRLEENLLRTEALESGRSDSTLAEIHTEFFLLIGRASHNPVLIMLIEALSQISRELLERIRPQSSGGRTSARRRPIVDAIRAKDAEAATRLLTEQLIGHHTFFLEHGGERILKARRRRKDKPAA